MKKNLIYTLCILLSGAITFSSCEDMLSVDSERVQYEPGDITLNDSVYSVLGILKSVQDVADRQILLGELRGDLVTVTDRAVLDIQAIANFTYDEENKYVSPRAYYSIINNCNLFLERVDTTLERENRKLMLREFVAAKSMRAWAYMQLAANYGAVPYFTEPILTHSAAKEVMAQPKKDMTEIANLLIEELLPYENPDVYPMPEWSGIRTGASSKDERSDIFSQKLFMPIRQLLGDLYLWKGDYRNAADTYYKMINKNYYNDNRHRAFFNEQKGANVSGSYHDLFYASANFGSDGTYLTVIPMETSSSTGTVSELASIFAPVGVRGGNQVKGSAGWVSLSDRQDYLYREGDDNKYTFYYFTNSDYKRTDLFEYPTSEKYKGDLRRYRITVEQEDKEETYKDIITKLSMPQQNAAVSEQTRFVVFSRTEHLYLRFAEALIGMARENGEDCVGALELAMDILKRGAREKNYYIVENVETTKTPVLNEDGMPMLDADGNEIFKYETTGDTITSYNFLDERYDGNKGIHSRGSGDSEYNVYYALNDTCVARYLGEYTLDDFDITLTKEITFEDRVNYMADLLIDELALECAFEGNRFTDLVRFAKAGNDIDILAKRVAGRAIENTVSYRHKDYQYDAALYELLKDKSNWYIKLPGSEPYVEPVVPEDEGAVEEEVPAE